MVPYVWCCVVMYRAVSVLFSFVMYGIVIVCCVLNALFCVVMFNNVGALELCFPNNCVYLLFSIGFSVCCWVIVLFVGRC